MITYDYAGAFGFGILFRAHGSAVFKSCTPALLSSVIYVLLYQFTDTARDRNLLDHPYPIAALVAAFSFLLIFRANFAYNRYWEAQTAIHIMHAKWLDVATELTAFHLQSNCYQPFQPPSFGDHTKIAAISQTPIQRRQQHDPITQNELSEQIDEQIEKDTTKDPSLRSRFSKTKSFRNLFRRNQSDKSEMQQPPQQPLPQQQQEQEQHTTSRRQPAWNDDATQTVRFGPSAVIRSKFNRHVSDFHDTDAGNATTPHNRFWKYANERLAEGHLGGDDAPTPFFLESIAHLLSLMSAVSLSTLRNDMEEAESPLANFRPNAPWPHVDPDDYAGDIRHRWYQSEHRSYTIIRYLLGLSRTDKARRLYNQGRPFRVIGNVSDAEIQALQTARGPQAKVTLVSFWLQELITREHLHGSTGKVPPPIVSRVYQFVSDGMAGYNEARKVAYIPFPFPHAQLTTLFILVIIGIIPVLMMTYLDNEYFGFVWNWFTVMCFTGLHEVARELENPFQNVPNEIPLNNFQAQFNEGLMIMFFGYHPDFYLLSETEQKNNEDDDSEGRRLPSRQDESEKPEGRNCQKEGNWWKPEAEKDASTASCLPPSKLEMTMQRDEVPLTHSSLQMSSLDDAVLFGGDNITTPAPVESESGTPAS